MRNNKKRVIFFAETVTLAHLTRCLIIAKALHETGKYIVALAADKRFDDIIDHSFLIRFPLNTISCAEFTFQLQKGLPVYNTKTLIRYVKDDLTVIEQFRPDFIFGDFRLSLGISSRLKKIPYANITNAYWSPYAKMEYPIPEIFLTNIFGVPFAQKIFNATKNLIFYIHSLSFNNACKKFGVKPLTNDMRDIYTYGDFTIYADIESLLPMKTLPENHFFIGPISWSANLPTPEWWPTLPNDKPIVFVTLGSSGDNSLLPMIIKTLSQMPVTVICATLKKTTIDKDYPNVFLAEFLPAEMVVKKSDIVICNGGSPMIYQSLVENKAIIGIPSNLDQYLMMSLIKEANRGYLIRAGQANPLLIREAVNKAIENTPSSHYEKPELALNKIMALIDLN
ncbi:MAG: glycosyltransferase [Methylovulum sp.]|nr:glycosyltransferase [Methylovulum sp.]